MSISDVGLTNKTETAGRVSFLDGQGEMPMLEVTTAWSTAEIYLQGATVTRFRKKDDAPLFFVSQCSRYEDGQPIRGGVPVVFPWFGPREGLPQHGFARHKAWELKEFIPAADGSVSVRFRLPEYPEASGFPPFTADYIVTVKDTLTLQLVVKNDSSDEELGFENCLHSYLEVGDINGVAIRGLKGVHYLDKVTDFARKTETEEAIRIGSEVNRIYLNTTATVEIEDRKLKRKIRIEKEGSQSTVVWNPWVSVAQQMPDFGNDEYQRMVCVESGNVASNSLHLAPGASSTLAVKLSTSS
jgi:D-hexose-6-phosphate mutarotase